MRFAHFWLMSRLSVTMALLVPFFAVTAQELPKTTDRQTNQQRLRVTLEHRSRAEHLTNDFRIGEKSATRALVERTRLRIRLGKNTDPARVLVEMQDSRGLLQDKPFFYEDNHTNTFDFLQLKADFLLDELIRGKPVELHVGRFTIDLGNRRLVARNNMRNTTNAFDGIHLDLGSNSSNQLDVFITRPVLINPTSLDSSARNGYFWGSYYQERLNPNTNIDFYYLGLHDDGRLGYEATYTTLGTRLNKSGMRGQFNYELESAWQFGSTNNLSHSAHFQHGSFGYTAPLRWEPNLSVNYDYASGDSEPRDKRFGTFDTLFGARSFELNSTGIYGPFLRSNLHTPGLNLQLRPKTKLQIEVSYRLFWLAQPTDHWVDSGLHDPTGNSGSFLGQQIEAKLRMDVQDYFHVEFGYAHLFKGDYLARVPMSPATPNSNFVYAAVNFKTPL